jgi:hypothetical protein
MHRISTTHFSYANAGFRYAVARCRYATVRFRYAAALFRYAKVQHRYATVRCGMRASLQRRPQLTGRGFYRSRPRSSRIWNNPIKSARC